MDNLTDRQKIVLSALIDHYVDSAEPVSSRLLQDKGGLDVSSATIRSEMNELENMGYLSQIHTSGGRVPTDKAYRLYVNNLKNENLSIPEKTRSKIKDTLVSTRGDIRDLNRVIAHLVSKLSDNLVIVGIEEEEDFYKFGLSNLFEFPEFREMNRVFKMTSFFDEFEDVFDQLFKTMEGKKPGTIRVLIGRENPYTGGRDESMILSEYQLPHNYTGCLTMVGPMRMDYGRNIGLIKATIEELNKLVN